MEDGLMARPLYVDRGQVKRARSIRATEAEWARWRAYCEKEGLDFQQWVRTILNGAARKGFRSL
jgi:hypothetical protein